MQRIKRCIFGKVFTTAVSAEFDPGSICAVDSNIYYVFASQVSQAQKEIQEMQVFKTVCNKFVYISEGRDSIATVLLCTCLIIYLMNISMMGC